MFNFFCSCNCVILLRCKPDDFVDLDFTFFFQWGTSRSCLYGQQQRNTAKNPAAFLLGLRLETERPNVRWSTDARAIHGALVNVRRLLLLDENDELC